MDMESYIIAYIARRMANLGFTKYSMEPLLCIIPEDKSVYEMDGTNEYYYLVSKTLVTGTEITSPGNYFKVEDGYTNLTFYKIQEFTGQIKVTSPYCVKQAIEFIRVTPVYPQP